MFEPAKMTILPDGKHVSTSGGHYNDCEGRQYRNMVTLT